MRWLRERLLRLLDWLRPPTVQPLVACTHRWPDGTSAWTPCEDKTTTCQRCGVRRKC